jgi:SLT domain-containing protein
MPHREGDQQYFSRRYEEESAAADTATNADARLAHLELAARYAQLAAAIREVEERLGVKPTPAFVAATRNPQPRPAQMVHFSSEAIARI